jgi:uncharacterized membrane protein
MESEEGPGMAKYGPRKRRAASSSPAKIARGLGWFSVGMGIAQILAPRLVSRLAGLPLPPAFTVACGVRELVCGIGILTQEQVRPWMQARVAGDALDLAAFGSALLVPGADRSRIAVSTAVVAGVTALDVHCSRELGKDRRRPAPRQLSVSVNIERSPGELYGFWRDLTNLPRVMPRIESIQVIDDVHSHWVLRTTDGRRVEWDAELIDDVPDERVAWRSVDGSAVFDAGSAQFVRAPSGGTDVKIDLLYQPPGDSFGTAVSMLFGIDPAADGRLDLDALKSVMKSLPPA